MKIIKNLNKNIDKYIIKFLNRQAEKDVKRQIKKVEFEFYKNLNIKVDLFQDADFNSLNEDQKRFLIYLLEKQKKESKRNDLIKFIMCIIVPWVSFFIMYNARGNNYMLCIHFAIAFVVILINFIG